MKLMSLYAAVLVLAGCSMPAPVGPREAEQSTVKVLDTHYAGTAWQVAPGRLMTAGHVCLMFTVDADQPFVVVRDRYIPVTTAQFEMSDDASADLCLLSVPHDVAPILPLAAAMPVTGDRVGFDGITSGPQHGEFRWPDRSTAPCAHGDSGSALYDAAGVWGVLVQSPPDDETGASGCLATVLPEIRSFLDAAKVHYDVAEMVQPDPLTE